MTIDSKWLKVLKEEAPEAFKSKCQFTPKCAVLDGMPLLMAGGHIEVCRITVESQLFIPLMFLLCKKSPPQKSQGFDRHLVSSGMESSYHEELLFSNQALF